MGPITELGERLFDTIRMCHFSCLSFFPLSPPSLSFPFVSSLIVSPLSFFFFQLLPLIYIDQSPQHPLILLSLPLPYPPTPTQTKKVSKNEVLVLFLTLADKEGGKMPRWLRSYTIQVLRATRCVLYVCVCDVMCSDMRAVLWRG